MRLLALITDGRGADGGIARYNEDLLKALSASSHIDHVTALPRFGNSEEWRGRQDLELEPCWPFLLMGGAGRLSRMHWKVRRHLLRPHECSAFCCETRAPHAL